MQHFARRAWAHRLLFLAGLICGVEASLSAQRPSAALIDGTRDAATRLRAAQARFDSLGAHGDVASFVRQFSDDGELILDDGRRVAGATAIAAWWSESSLTGSRLIVTRDPRIREGCTDGGDELGGLSIVVERGKDRQVIFRGLYGIRWRAQGSSLSIRRMQLWLDSWKLDAAWLRNGCVDPLPVRFRAHRVQLIAARAKRPTFERQVADGLTHPDFSFNGIVSDHALFMNDVTVRLAFQSFSLEVGGETRTDRRSYSVSYRVPPAPPYTDAGTEFDATFTDREAHALVLRRFADVFVGLGVTATRTVLATNGYAWTETGGYPVSAPLRFVYDPFNEGPVSWRMLPTASLSWQVPLTDYLFLDLAGAVRSGTTETLQTKTVVAPVKITHPWYTLRAGVGVAWF